MEKSIGSIFIVFIFLMGLTIACASTPPPTSAPPTLTHLPKKTLISPTVTIQDVDGEILSIDISNCNNETGGEMKIDANREYIAITRPGCWAKPDEAWDFKSSVRVSMSVDGVSIPFVGYGPTEECLPGGVDGITKSV